MAKKKAEGGSGNGVDGHRDVGRSLMDYERDLRKQIASLIPLVASIATPDAIEAIAEACK